MNPMITDTSNTESIQLQKNILVSLSSSPGDSAAQCAKLRPFLERTGNEACRILLNNLVHIEFNDENASKHWEAIVNHASLMQKSLRRNVGLATAACDYFSSVEPRMTNPRLVEYEMFEETIKLAHHDYLTQLLSRSAFQEILEQDISRARRHGRSSTLIFFDLDNFKEINDTYGHLAGDAVLKNVGRTILQSKRMEDIACRYGGDEFVILLPETDKITGAKVSRKLHNLINGIQVNYDNKTIKVGCSGGLAAFPQDCATPMDLIKCADQALYKAKNLGRHMLAEFNG